MINEIISDEEVRVPKFSFDPVLKILYSSTQSLIEYLQENIGIENLPKGYFEKPEKMEDDRMFRKIATKQITGLTPLQAHLIEFNLAGVKRIS